LSESIQPEKIIENASTAAILREYLRPPRDDSQDEKDARAISAAGRYLKLTALARAKEMLAPGIQNDDDQIARIETMLRAARHMRRTSVHNGDPIPSIQRADGSRIHLITRLIEVMGRDRVIQGDESDDRNSRSKANRDIREARNELKDVADKVIREGEIVA